MPSHSYLPPEILVKIFEYLSLADRKQVRLVCKIWSNISKQFSIVKDEKFVFRANYRSIFRALNASNFAQFNLEFQGRRIDQLPISLWKKCGHKIRTLRFYCCRLDREVFKNIFLYCNNLESINVDEKLAYLARENNCSNFESLIFALDYLIERNTICNSVNALRIIERSKISISAEDTFKRVLLVFPLLKHFSVRILACGGQSEIEEAEISLNLFTQLESFAYYNLNRHKFGFTLDTSVQMWPSRLVEFETKIPNSMDITCIEKILPEFFSTQKNLRTVKLDAENRSMSLKKLMFHILNNCLSLSTLRIGCGSILELSSSEVAQFLASITHLQSLELACYLEPAPMTYSSLSTGNLALNTLEFYSSSTANSFFCALLKSCHKLKHLECHEPSKDLLREIFKNMTNLRSLKLIGHDEFTSLDPAGIENEGFSIDHLKKLEYLEINSNVKILCESQLLHLKHFNASCMALQTSFSQLCKIVWCMPMLQSLEIRSKSFEVNMDEIIQLCEPLENLNCLTVILGDFQIWELYQLFAACSNLRYLIAWEEVYLFNPDTAEIKRCEHNFEFP